MARYSEVVESKERKFKYDYEKKAIVWFEPATQEELAKDAAFRENNPHGLLVLDDENNKILKSFRCDTEEWEDISVRDELLEECHRRINETSNFLAQLARSWGRE